MSQIEIDLKPEEVAFFDQVFWRFVDAELYDDKEADVRLDAFALGPWERRVVTFGEHCSAAAAAFEHHWRLVRGSKPRPAALQREGEESFF